MNARTFMLALACLLLASNANAQRSWVGLQLGAPLPWRDAGERPQGIDAGLTLHTMGNPHVGAGVDVAYHYWPASAEYRLAYDRYLRTTRYQAMGSETWAFHVMQATAHLRLVGPTRLRTSPWMQVGAGAYRINRNLSPPDWSGSPLIYLGPVRTIEFTHGLNASAGISFWTSPDTQIGLRANYHYLVSMTDGVPALEVATVGAHFLFGLPQRHK